MIYHRGWQKRHSVKLSWKQLKNDGERDRRQRGYSNEKQWGAPERHLNFGNQ
jgi:hypothetical protein